jgi:hypothetical protein
MTSPQHRTIRDGRAIGPGCGTPLRRPGHQQPADVVNRRPRNDLQFLEGCEVTERPDEGLEVEVPEPLKRVRVLPPFLVAHDGTQHWPIAIAEVPESIAAHWILNRWAEAAEAR